MWAFLVRFGYFLSACAIVVLGLLWYSGAHAAGASSVGCVVRSGSVVMVRPCAKIVPAASARSSVPHVASGRRLTDPLVASSVRARSRRALGK